MTGNRDPTRGQRKTWGQAGEGGKSDGNRGGEAGSFRKGARRG